MCAFLSLNVTKCFSCEWSGFTPLIWTDPVIILSCLVRSTKPAFCEPSVRCMYTPVKNCYIVSVQDMTQERRCEGVGRGSHSRSSFTTKSQLVASTWREQTDLASGDRKTVSRPHKKLYDILRWLYTTICLNGDKVQLDINCLKC